MKEFHSMLIYGFFFASLCIFVRIERFSIECRYKNAEVISTANQKKERKMPLNGTTEKSK